MSPTTVAEMPESRYAACAARYVDGGGRLR